MDIVEQLAEIDRFMKKQKNEFIKVRGIQVSYITFG